MRCGTVAVFVLALSAAVASARADDVDRLKLAREIVDVTHLADKIRGILPSLGPVVRQALSREMVDPATGEKAALLVQAPSPDDLERLMDQVTALYARELTEEDLSDILAFYRTPSGRDMLAKEAEIGGAIGMLAQHWAVALADRTVAERAGTAASPAPQPRREDDVATRTAALQKYLDPMDKPQWTALRTVTLAKLIADWCRGVRLDQRVLGDVLHTSGLDTVSIGDMDTMKAIVAPAFSYVDTDALKLLCAASDDLFGAKGRLVPNLLSPGEGAPKTSGRGYVPVPPFTSFPHGRA